MNLNCLVVELFFYSKAGKIPIQNQHHGSFFVFLYGQEPKQDKASSHKTYTEFQNVYLRLLWIIWKKKKILETNTAMTHLHSASLP